MTVEEIMKLTGMKSRTTLRLWMIERGFPRPVVKGHGRSRQNEWDRAAVEAWWAENQDKMGRHPA